uniref:Dolichyl-diphosphooligosaccharide--protein glycosyltransferase subunit 2 n=1 Tax=Ganoderma boninense TaxID=34458 RepID=A0A5K1K4U6_9APHY|nr:Dolichyl-diphosphooligosaccharide--protein glycosyltransferase subunit 2 [Ganoderma boninense]
MLTSVCRGAILLLGLAEVASATGIDRHAIVSRYNPSRNASSNSTPMQVGNGHFAFGADVTGLQSFLPFATMSDWGWKNDSLPDGTTEADLEAFRGETWDNVTYLFGGPEPLLDWLTGNPGRVNLGRVGLLFVDEAGNAMDVAEADLEETKQTLDLWTGTMTSSFQWLGEEVVVQTVAAQNSDAVAVTIESALVEQGRLGVFLDFPWNDGRTFIGFQAPFVGYWNETSKHTTSLTTGPDLGKNIAASISHTMVNNTFFTAVGGGDSFAIERVSPDEHRYTILPNASSSSFSLTIAYALDAPKTIPAVRNITTESESVWVEYWSKNGFIDLVTESSDSRADELQRRIILSRYLLRVNEAGDTPPQEVRRPQMFRPSVPALIVHL